MKGFHKKMIEHLVKKEFNMTCRVYILHFAMYYKIILNENYNKAVKKESYKNVFKDEKLVNSFCQRIAKEFLMYRMNNNFKDEDIINEFKIIGMIYFLMHKYKPFVDTSKKFDSYKVNSIFASLIIKTVYNDDIFQKYKQIVKSKNQTLLNLNLSSSNTANLSSIFFDNFS